MDLCWQILSLLFNMLSRLVITFLPRSKHLLISWLQSTSAVILEPRKINSDTVSIVSPSICHEVMGPDAMILVFWMLSFKPNFSLSSFHLMKKGMGISAGKVQFQLCPCEYKIQLLFWVPELTCFLLWPAEFSFKSRRMSQRDWKRGSTRDSKHEKDSKHWCWFWYVQEKIPLLAKVNPQLAENEDLCPITMRN